VEAARLKEVQQATKRRAYSQAVGEQMEALAESQRKRKVWPSALDPVLAEESTPMQQTKGAKSNKLFRLLQLSVLAMMLHPFGATLASWTTGVAVGCGAKWSRESINLAVQRGPHPTARASDAVALVHEDIEHQVEAGFTEAVFWDKTKDNLPAHFKVSPVAIIP
jgi:predicted anti-sigma-YlaC factor YlaD